MLISVCYLRIVRHGHRGERTDERQPRDGSRNRAAGVWADMGLPQELIEEVGSIEMARISLLVRTPAEVVAETVGHVKVARFLLEYGADVSDRTSTKWPNCM